VARVVEEEFGSLKAPPRRIGLPDYPTPTSPALSNDYYPRAAHIVAAVRWQFGIETDPKELVAPEGAFLDQPDKTFTGPF
jgi:pyruvate dehydrogenase E1 component beta subunit